MQTSKRTTRNPRGKPNQATVKLYCATFIVLVGEMSIVFLKKKKKNHQGISCTKLQDDCKFALYECNFNIFHHLIFMYTAVLFL